MAIYLHRGAPRAFKGLNDQALRAGLAKAIPIGGGGFSIVVGGEILPGQQVAVKLQKDIDSGYFIEREGRRTSNLEPHPNILEHYSHGNIDGLAFIALELTNGQTVKDEIASSGRLYFRRTLNIIEKTLRGLAHVHAMGMVHRDITPSSIFINQGEVKLADFSLICEIGKLIKIEEEEEDLVVGTARYIPPSILIKKPPTIKNDLYSLGLVAYEMLTGRSIVGEILDYFEFEHNCVNLHDCHSHVSDWVQSRNNLSPLEKEFILKLTSDFNSAEEALRYILEINFFGLMNTL